MDKQYKTKDRKWCRPDNKIVFNMKIKQTSWGRAVPSSNLAVAEFGKV